MRKWVKITLWTILPLAAVIVCAVRWQAWFGMPSEPRWTGDTLNIPLPTFASEQVAVFEPTEQGWKDTIGPDSLVFLVLGDIHSQLRQADYQRLAERVPQADVVAQVGDWLDRGYSYYHQLLLREYTPTHLVSLPIINCPGNHEYVKGPPKRLASQWNEWFPQPVGGPTGVPGVNYFVDFPQVRFIVLDTNPLDRLVYLTRTLTWLRTAMYDADGRFIVVMMHHPVISARKGRFCPLIYATFHHALSQADFVLCGHDHSYMRKMPFVMLNTAGRTKPIRSSLKAESVSNEPVYGILTVKQSDTNHPSQMSFTICRLADGEILDSIYVSHD